MTGEVAKKPVAIFLMGPTASGKTDLAITLADRYPVELISVDSALIYKGMDIGTAKPEPELLAKYPHHLIDILDPSEAYSVAEFVRDARGLMQAAATRGKVPLLVGGTMLYFKGLLEGLADLPASDGEVRRKILQEAEVFGWPHMHNQLKQVDPVAAERVHPNHSQRIQRALEVFRLSGTPMTEILKEQQTKGSLIPPVNDDFDVIQLGLIPSDRSWLHERIEMRFLAMLEQGFQNEVELLRCRSDLSVDLPSIRAVGYRQMWEFLEGGVDRGTMIEKGLAATRQLAKRQLTWLRKWPDLQEIIIDPVLGNNERDDYLLNKALNFLEKAVI